MVALRRQGSFVYCLGLAAQFRRQTKYATSTPSFNYAGFDFGRDVACLGGIVRSFTVNLTREYRLEMEDPVR